MLNEAIQTSDFTLRGERSYPRFSVDARVGLVRQGAPDPMICRTKNLSWDGASLLVSGRGLGLEDTVMLRFPSGRRGTFCAHAQVIWSQKVDETRSRVGVIFTKLRVRDEKKLKQLLKILSREHEVRTGYFPLTDMLKLRFLDHAETLAALEQVRLGCIETTLFHSLRADERVPIVLTGLAGLPRLHLRGRILWQKAVGEAAHPPGSAMFQTAVVFDHPHEDLKQVTTRLIARLKAINHLASVAGVRSTEKKRYRKAPSEQMRSTSHFQHAWDPTATRAASC